MTTFDNEIYETTRKQYEFEAKQRWGETDAYKEHTEKTANYPGTAEFISRAAIYCK